MIHGFGVGTEQQIFRLSSMALTRASAISRWLTFNASHLLEAHAQPVYPKRGYYTQQQMLQSGRYALTIVVLIALTFGQPDYGVLHDS